MKYTRSNQKTMISTHIQLGLDLVTPSAEFRINATPVLSNTDESSFGLLCEIYYTFPDN